MFIDQFSQQKKKNKKKNSPLPKMDHKAKLEKDSSNPHAVCFDQRSCRGVKIKNKAEQKNENNFVLFCKLSPPSNEFWCGNLER